MSIGGSPVPAAPAAEGLAMAAQPLKAMRLSDQLAARLSAQIESGGVKPGDRLPTELQLAKEHGVSRTVVREAVHQLKSRHLIVSRQGSGVYVAHPEPNRALAFDPGVLGSMTAVFQIFEVRRALEGEIAALAAQRANRRQVAAIRRALAALAAATTAGRDGVEEDLAFHRAMADAAGNPQFTLLLGFLEQYLREVMRVSRGHAAARPDFMAAALKEHAAIAEAIAAGNATAARRHATRHMQQSARRLEASGATPPAAAMPRRRQPKE